MRRIINNWQDQLLVASFYAAMALALFARPDTGPLLLHLKATTIFNSNSIGIIYTMCFGYLMRLANIPLWKYILALIPILVSSFYFFFYTLEQGTTTTPIVSLMAMGFSVALLAKVKEEAFA